jgi:hypothetical protein
MALGSTQSLTESFLGVKSGRRVGLTTLPPSVSRMSENVGTSTSRNLKGLHGMYRETLPYLSVHIERVLESKIWKKAYSSDINNRRLKINSYGVSLTLRIKVAAVYTIIFHFKNILPQILFVCLK